MDRITPRELVRPSIVDERSAFDLQALAFLVAAVLTGVFVILFLLAFLPWLLSGALTAAVESLMRQVGFAKFTVDSIGDWVLVFVVGALSVAILVAAVTAIAGVANLLSYHLTSRRDRGPAVPARSHVAVRRSGRQRRGRGSPPRDPAVRGVERSTSSTPKRDTASIPGRSRMNKAQLIRALRRN